MNFTDRISNQTTIYYSQGRYNRDYLSPNRVLSSSAGGGSPTKQKKWKESTKDWVARSFYSKSADFKNSTHIVTNPKPPAATVDDRVNGNSGKEDSQDQKGKNLYDGKPAVFFRQSLIDSQAEKFRFCLVGKFPKWRPSLSQIREWADAKWRLKGQWSITLLDHRHVFVTLDNEDDMVRVWGRNRWFVGGHLMKVFKWFPTFVPSKEEPSTAAIWVSLPLLPVVFFQEELLSPIAGLAGKVLGIDGPTRNLSRTNVARVCVEVDLLKDVPRQVWVGVGEGGGFWQDLCYERLPPYCADCRQQGHSTKACQASRSHSRSKTAKPKPSIKNSNSQTRVERRSQEYFSKTKRVRISPIIEDEDESSRATRQDSNQSKRKGKAVVESSASEPSLPLSPAGSSLGEERGNRSNAGTSEQVVLAEDPNLTDSEGDAVPRAQSAPSHTEVGGKGFGLTQGKSFHRLERISLPKTKKPSSKRPIFFWKTKQKEIPAVELRPLRPPPTVVKYKYSEIKKMTRTFRDKLGEGGFGTVYRGTLPDGRDVAVKLRREGVRDEQFSNEIKIIREIYHTNVIRLLGFCSERARTALVFEFMPNGALDKFIYSSESESSYSQRSKQLCKIAVGVARGFEYLHHGCDPAIVHLDVKPSNILLDKNLCPKLSDFGLARRPEWSGPVVSVIKGTFGYMAPEYALWGMLSTKADVYSYGVMLLEMATRRKPVNFGYVSDSGPQEKFLVDWVTKTVNPSSHGGISGYIWEATERKMILVGLWCTQYNPSNRPSFSTIVDMLEGSVEDLNPPPLDPAGINMRPSFLEAVSDHPYSVEDSGNVDDDANVSCSTSSLVGR